MVIIVLLVINKQSKQRKLIVVDILTNQIKDVQSRRQKIRLPELETFFTNISIFPKDESISLSQLTNIVLSKSDYSYRRKQRIIKNVIPEIFQKTNEIKLTNLVELLLQKYFDNTNNIHNPYGDTFILLRYRKLLSYMTNKILENCCDTNKEKYIDMYSIWLDYIKHPDMLRIRLELNKLIPKNSQLRKDKIWSDALPIIFRDDCLPIYLEITRNPKKYNWVEWSTAHGALLYFTNDIAVTEYKKGIKNIQKVHKNLHPLIIRNMRSRIKYQNDFCTGKKPLIERPKPLLDE